MENKTKVKVAVVIGIVILAVIFIIMVVFVKGNKKNNNIPRKGDANYVDPTVKNNVQEQANANIVAPTPTTGEKASLDNVVSIGIKNGYLVKVNSDLTSTNVKQIAGEYSDICYGDNKAYVVTNQGSMTSVVEIDLSRTDYPEKEIISTADYGNLSNIEYYEGKLYFVTGIGQLVEYSISESFARGLTNANEVSNFAINKVKNVMYVSYKPNGENAGIYVLDFTTNNLNQIINLNDLTGRLLLNGNSLVIDVKDYGSFYVYDIENNTVNAIGADSYLKPAENQIAFYNDIILYTNGSAISLKKANGEIYQDDWYILNDNSIASISMIDASKLQLARYDQNGRNGGNVTRSVIIDLNDGTTSEEPNSVYLDLLRIK